MNSMETPIPRRLQEQKKRMQAQRPSKAVAYIRVSDESQIEGESLDTQCQPPLFPNTISRNLGGLASVSA
jgi:hypothetical protein